MHFVFLHLVLGIHCLFLLLTLEDIVNWLLDPLALLHFVVLLRHERRQRS